MIAKSLASGALLALTLAVAAPADARPADDDRARHPVRSQSSHANVHEDDDGDGRPNLPDVDGDADNRHPSGKDRSAEGGRSGSQGRSLSEPDQNGKGPERDHGGTDKPGGSGGIDIFDQDYNNGCGNDDDFEDDNEGWCGRPTEDIAPPPLGPVFPPVGITPRGPIIPPQLPRALGPRHGPPALPRVSPPLVSSGSGATRRGAFVRGVVETRSGAVTEVSLPEPLARTGWTSEPLILAGTWLLACGYVVRRFPDRAGFRRG